MAHVADELEFDEAQRERAHDDEFGLDRVPDIVNDRRALRLVPWHGEGPDPLAEDEVAG